MKKNIFQLIPMVTVIMLSGCGDGEVDLTPPTMEVVNYVPQPSMDEVCGTQEPVVFNLTGGDQLIFDVIFKDNEALSQYKVDVHNNFDCHGHGEGNLFITPVPDVNNMTTDWTILDIQDISGLNAPVARSFDVPENVTTGNYHFQIQVLDESGNDNPAANFFTLKIKNPLDDIAPEIDVNEPSTSSFSIKKGETIRFSGMVTDDRSLSDGGNGVLYLFYTDLSSGNTFATSEVIFFDENVEQQYDFDIEYTVPLTLVARNYRYTLAANDGVRNVATFQSFEVEVTN